MKQNKHLLAKYMFVVLVALLVPVLPSSANSPATTTRGQDPQKIKPLKGEALKLLVSRLRSRNKGFDRAMKDMERMGKKPFWEASAAIPLNVKKRTQTAMLRPASYAEPQDIISDEYGNEMVFITYDGDNGYWDGTVYVHDAEREATYNAVVEDYGSLDSASWDVIDEVYYPSDGSDPYREQPCSGDSACLIADAKIQPRQPQRAVHANASYAAVDPASVGGGWWRNWWGCTRTGCQQAVTGCAGSGTFRRLFVCSAVGCTARAIACALT